MLTSSINSWCIEDCKIFDILTNKQIRVKKFYIRVKKNYICVYIFWTAAIISIVFYVNIINPKKYNWAEHKLIIVDYMHVVCNSITVFLKYCLKMILLYVLYSRKAKMLFII